MFNYFVARMENLMFMNTALLRRIKRRLLRNLRNKEELSLRLKTLFGTDVRTGNVDKLFADVQKGATKFENLEADIVKQEERLTVVEGRSFKGSVDVEQEYHKLHEEIFGKLGPFLSTDPVLRKAGDYISEAHTMLAAFVVAEKQALQGEYLALNREAARKQGVFQNFVWSENEVRSAVDAVTRERGEVRGIKSEVHHAEGLYKRIVQFAGTIEHGDSKVNAQLLKVAEEYRDTIKKLCYYYSLALGDFVLTIKTLVNLEFKFEREEESITDELLKVLERTGYPRQGPEGLEEITLRMKRAHDATEGKEGAVTDAFVRMSRLLLNATANV
jgi:hypothetical protein